MRLRIFALVVLFFNAETFGLSKIFEGEQLSEREIVLKIDTKYRVKECNKWLLVDIKMFDSNLWLEIEGILEVTESERMGNQSHFIRGKFTYSSSDHAHDYRAIVHPGSIVYLRGKSDSPVKVKEYEWFEKGNPCNEINS
jgi:hypothetical protein